MRLLLALVIVLLLPAPAVGDPVATNAWLCRVAPHSQRCRIAPSVPPVAVVPIEDIPIPVSPVVVAPVRAEPARPKPKPRPRPRDDDDDDDPPAKPRPKGTANCKPLTIDCNTVCSYARVFSESTLESMRITWGYCAPTASQRSHAKACIRKQCPEVLKP